MARMLSLDKSALKKPVSGSEMGTGSLAGNGDDDLGMQQSNWRLLGLAFFLLFYLAMGASVFSAIEGPIETEAVKSLEEKQAAFLKKFPCVEAHDLEQLMSDVVDANNRGVSIGWNGSVSVPSWSFGQSFFFSSTVITTIGYGHQSPLSSEGKVFCIIYALLGIPMTLILFSALIERLQIPVQFLLDLMKSKIGHLYQPIYVYLIHFTFVCTMSTKIIPFSFSKTLNIVSFNVLSYQWTLFVSFIFQIVCLVIILMFLLPAAVFTALETNWNYLDSLYYCFISLTTIGLGDFIPGDSPGQALRPLYKACTTFYLLAGVVSMMLLLSVFYNIPQCNFKLFFLLRPGGCCSSNNGRGPGQNGGERVDPERIRLQSSSSGPKYTQHLEDPEGNARRTRVIRAKSRPCEDSPSPTEEEPSSFSGQTQ